MPTRTRATFMLPTLRRPNPPLPSTLLQGCPLAHPTTLGWPCGLYSDPLSSSRGAEVHCELCHEIALCGLRRRAGSDLLAPTHSHPTRIRVPPPALPTADISPRPKRHRIDHSKWRPLARSRPALKRADIA